jgi:protein-disulfide isomerase
MKYCLLTLLIIIISLPSCTGVDPESKAFQDAVVKAIEAKKEEVFKIMSQEARESRVRQREEAREKAKADMEKQFETPLKPVIEGRHITGTRNAPVTIVEYSDFQCPHCKRGSDTVRQIMKIYGRKVRLIFKHLPLPGHRNALVAAKGAVAAEKQGRFKEYKRILFNNQKKINRNFVLSTAKSLGMNLSRFTREMDSPETEKMIRADMAEAKKFGITGTPAFIINGVALKGAYPIKEFKAVIDRHLKKK